MAVPDNGIHWLYMDNMLGIGFMIQHHWGSLGWVPHFFRQKNVQHQVARHPEIVSISLGGQEDDDEDAATAKESARLTAS